VHKPKLISLSSKVDVKDLFDQNNLSSSSPWQDISTWNRRPELRKAKEVSDDSLVCGACRVGLLVGQQDTFFLNDIWSPTLVAGDSLEEVRGESTSNYHQVNGSAQQSDVQIGCRCVSGVPGGWSLMNETLVPEMDHLVRTKHKRPKEIKWGSKIFCWRLDPLES